jgi:hypothetical protein
MVVCQKVTQVAGSSESRLESWVPVGRRLIAVDLENLVGGASASSGDVKAVMQQVLELVAVGDTDVMVLACGPTLMGTSAGLLPCRPILGKGLDGADRALLDYVDPHYLSGRFASVVLASGDGRAFTPVVRELAAIGVPTDVLSRPESVAASLVSAARSYTPLSFAIAA